MTPIKAHLAHRVSGGAPKQLFGAKRQDFDARTEVGHLVVSHHRDNGAHRCAHAALDNAMTCVRIIIMCGLALGAAGVILALVSSAGAAEKDTPTWKKPVPGAQAFLGDDGGGVNTATVCDTADHYRDWLQYEHPSGCQTFQHDLPVIIEVVTLDPVTDSVAGQYYRPIVKIHIPSRNFTGYLNLDVLHPVIPPGTMVEYKKLGNGKLLLFPSPKIPAKDEGGIDLGDSVSAKVISYDPTNDDNFDFHVQITSSPHAGQTGWVLAFGAVGQDGVPIDQFDKAVISK